MWYYKIELILNNYILWLENQTWFYVLLLYTIKQSHCSVFTEYAMGCSGYPVIRYVLKLFYSLVHLSHSQTSLVLTLVC